jgi:hypothetical protein
MLQFFNTHTKKKLPLDDHKLGNQIADTFLAVPSTSIINLKFSFSAVKCFFGILHFGSFEREFYWCFKLYSTGIETRRKGGKANGTSGTRWFGDSFGLILKEC